MFSRLPLFILYGFARLIYFALSYVIQYRKQVIETNLSNSFPNVDAKTLRQYKMGFYKYLSEIFVETIKAYSISDAELRRRCYVSPDSLVISQIKNEPTSVIMLSCHVGNWEWVGMSIGLQFRPRPVHIVYLNLAKNDDVMKGIRERTGNKLIFMQMVYRHLIEDATSRPISCLAADQTPQRHKIGTWIPFLNQDTPFFTGPGKMARKLNLPVYFAYAHRVSLGKYELRFEKLFAAGQAKTDEEIMTRYAQKLEQIIHESPSQWLWSHKRWKHKR